MGMPSRIHLADANYLLILQSPLLFLCGKWLEANPQYRWVTAVPDWAYPFSIGVALATLWYDLLRGNDSRVWQFWHKVSDKFEVAHLHAGHWSGPEWGGVMPATDIGVRLRIRFIRKVRRVDLVLRVYSCTGRGQQPFEYVLKIANSYNAQAGQTLDIPIVDMGIPTAGWDHKRKRGWGPLKTENFIGGSRNVAILECHGRWLTQRRKIYIEMISHVGQKLSPCLYVQEEGDDVFDTSAQNKLGIYRYDG
ncbi:hypothetical protein [Sphingobium sp. LB126]|uniref:hypothetical protein n=1 Tax=Sphingobium sp. LB126 TaxID=1983755 RepID=UPI0012FE70AF|nr:hypothetical protein [Sphingobium sp. LB126]